jgi:hypothetical protein
MRGFVEVILQLKLQHKILRVGHYLPTIFSDVDQFVRKCEPCQLFTGKQKLVALPLQLVVVEAPF